MRPQRHLVIMIKEPRPGRVKTRLAADMGVIPATWWFRHQSRRLIRRMQDPRWTLSLSIAPDIATASPIWPHNLPRISQGHGDLGRRMARVFRNFPPGPLCLIGADIPDIRPHHIAEAFDLLGRNDAVFGPATDGGYWLVGLKRTARPPVKLFQNVRWSSPDALSDTVAGLRDMRIGYCAQLRDIDTVDDLA